MIDGKIEVYRDEEANGKRSLLVRADSAEAALMKYQEFQQANGERNPWRERLNHRRSALKSARTRS